MANCEHRMYVAGRGGGFPRGGPRGGFTGSGTGRGFEADGRLQTCYKCGGPNHFARDCHAKSVKCYACGKFEGHIVRFTFAILSNLQSRDCPYAAQTSTDAAAGVPQPTVES